MAAAGIPPTPAAVSVRPAIGHRGRTNLARTVQARVPGGSSSSHVRPDPARSYDQRPMAGVYRAAALLLHRADTGP